MIIGRLSDTGSFENKPGYCVLRSLDGWTMAVNEAFVQGGTDRAARFALTSEMPTETMADSDVALSQVENDRETHWRIIYNREIKWVLDTGRYQLAYDKTRKITPTNPASLSVTDHRATGGRANKPVLAKRWVLESVTVSPETPPQGWSYSAQSSSAHYTIYNGDKADFQWTPPPQQIDVTGFTVSLSVQARPIPNNRLAAIISVSGSGLNTDTPQDGQNAYAKAENGSAASAQASVTFKPTANSTGLEVKIGMMWAITFTYKYRLAQ
jgi:hypothetical protein